MRLILLGFKLLSSQTGEVNDAEKKGEEIFSLATHDELRFAQQASSPFSLKMTLGIAQSFVRPVKQINQSIGRSPLSALRSPLTLIQSRLTT